MGSYYSLLAPESNSYISQRGLHGSAETWHGILGRSNKHYIDTKKSPIRHPGSCRSLTDIIMKMSPRTMLIVISPKLTEKRRWEEDFDYSTFTNKRLTGALSTFAALITAVSGEIS